LDFIVFSVHVPRQFSIEPDSNSLGEEVAEVEEPLPMSSRMRPDGDFKSGAFRKSLTGENKVLVSIIYAKFSSINCIKRLLYLLNIYIVDLGTFATS
jgi:hypothetical protein